MYASDLAKTEPRRGFDGNTVIFDYRDGQPNNPSRITLSISPFKEYQEWSVHRELSDVLGSGDLVLNIQNFFPYGVKCEDKQLGQGLGPKVMENLVFPLSLEYDVSMIYCNTGSDYMKRMLNNLNFAPVQHYTPDIFGNLWQPFYKLL